MRQNDKIGQQFGIIHDFDPIHDYRSQNSQGPLRLLANFVFDNHGRGGATTIFARGPPCEYCIVTGLGKLSGGCVIEHPRVWTEFLTHFSASLASGKVGLHPLLHQLTGIICYYWRIIRWNPVLNCLIHFLTGDCAAIRPRSIGRTYSIITTVRDRGLIAGGTS